MRQPSHAVSGPLRSRARRVSPSRKELLDQVGPRTQHADIEDLHDVHVVERRSDAGLLQEPLGALRVFDTGRRHVFQSHVPLQARVAGAIDIGHPAARQQFNDVIRSRYGADAEYRVLLCEIACCERERRRFEEAGQAAAGGRQRVSFGGEIRVALGELLPEMVAFVRAGGQPGIVPFGQQLPSLSTHSKSRTPSS
jgi:hypothetical protein